jgi:hypothetical protein
MKWKRTIGWGLAGLGMLLIVAVVVGYLYLRSNRFQQYALSKIVEQAAEATGGRTEIGGLDFSLSTLTAHLYNITMRGTEGPSQPPLVHADKLTVRIKIVSALHRQVALRELLIEHPVVHFQVSKDGKNNLPATPPSQTSVHTSVFDLAVQHAQLTNGEVNYNDRTIPVEADLYDLGSNIRFDSLLKRYEGTVSYASGNIHYAQYSPLSHSLNLTFDASPDHFNLQSAALKVGSSAVTLHAALTDYSHPTADGDYQIQIHTQDFASMSFGVSTAGDVVVSGKFHYQPIEGQPLLRNISVNGELASKALTGVASGSRVELRNLQGPYQLADGNLELKMSLSNLSAGASLLTPRSSILTQLRIHRFELRCATFLSRRFSACFGRGRSAALCLRERWAERPRLRGRETSAICAHIRTCRSKRQRAANQLQRRRTESQSMERFMRATSELIKPSSCETRSCGFLLQR